MYTMYRKVNGKHRGNPHASLQRLSSARTHRRLVSHWTQVASQWYFHQRDHSWLSSRFDPGHHRCQTERSRFTHGGVHRRGRDSWRKQSKEGCAEECFTLIGWKSGIKDVRTFTVGNRCWRGGGSGSGTSASVSEEEPSLSICFFSSRDIRNASVGTLSQRISNQLMGLKGLTKSLYDVRAYLDKLLANKLPLNHQILSHIQDMFNLLPDITHQDLIKSIYVKTNDEMLLVYLSSLIRSIIALHNLIMNKIQNSDAEKLDALPSASSTAATTATEKKSEKGSGDKATTNGSSSWTRLTLSLCSFLPSSFSLSFFYWNKFKLDTVKRVSATRRWSNRRV